jgi:ATP-binding cassette subfamily B protein
MGFRVVKNRLELEKEEAMTPYEREKDYVRRTILLKDFAKEIKTTNIFVVLEKRFRSAIDKNIGVIKQYGWKIAVIECISDYFAEIIPVTGGFLYGCYRLIIVGDIPISDFSVLVSAITTCRNKLNQLAYYFAMQQKHCLWVQNLRAFLDYEPKIQSGEIIPDEFKSLEFRNVSFKYTEDTDYILKNVSFKLEKGQTIAVVGHNGAGKTTLSKLIMRFYDVTEGEILYNGINIKEYDLLKYRERFASVFQDYRVFAMTVAENVLTEEVTDENKELIVNALKLAGAYDKIGTLPHKENSLLTKEFDQNGVLLSGGETQKVTIARLFARAFDVAVLDEPSSALDPVAESRMYDALLEGTKGKTVIYISHRLSSATRSDNILVFNKGVLSECGSHEELMKKNGYYCEMFTLQAAGYKGGEQE